MRKSVRHIVPCSTESAARRSFSHWSVSSSLGAHRTFLIAGALACATGRTKLLEDILISARRARVRRTAMEEALLQCYLFAGFPRAIEGLTVLHTHWPGSARRAHSAPGSLRARGTRLCREVYGKNFKPLMRNMSAIHPDLADWLILEGYGKVLSRKGLDVITRELCAACVLASLPAPRQLEAHLTGALNVGATRQQLKDAISLVSLACGVRVFNKSQAQHQRHGSRKRPARA